MNKMKEYERGREDGLDLALRIVRDGGIEALVKANCPYLKVGERKAAPVIYVQNNGQVAFG